MDINRLLWSKRLQVLFFFLLVVVIIVISIASLIQTEAAFEILNDGGLSVFGIPIGVFLSWCFAIFIQYSQNAALYINKHYCNNVSLVKWKGFKWLTTKNVAIAWFVFACAIDAVTNMIWYYNRTLTSVRPNPALAIATDFVIYGLMLLCVFVEEVLGLCLDIFTRATRELRAMSPDGVIFSFKKKRETPKPVAKKGGYTPPKKPATPTQYRPSSYTQSRLANLNTTDEKFKPDNYDEDW